MFSHEMLHSKMTSQNNIYRDSQVDTELEHKSKKVSDKISETVNVIANEPSLAFFRIQEHVRKTLPQLVDTKHEVEDVQSMVQGACFDTEYATNAVKMMQSSAIHFQNIQDLLKNAMFMKQQISYEEARKKQGRASPVKSGSAPGRAPATSDKKSRSDTKMTEAEARPPPSNPTTAPQIRNVPVERDTASLEDSAENKEVESFMARSPSPSKK